jgi:hypothetical protein
VTEDTVAQRALPAGTPRRRTAFGLLDADGWTAAFFKALFWFLLIIFLLGYVPDRLYYFTVANTVDFGYNAISLVNFCDPANEDLPCPAPVGAVVPWQESPAELALPAPVAGGIPVLSGTNLYVIGGESGGAATAEAVATQVTTDGNFAPWQAGPALPEPRSGVAAASVGGVPYIIGGLDAAGAPTRTVFGATLEEGVINGWQALDGTEDTADLTLPVALSGAAAVAAPNGIYLFGGRTADGLSDRVFHSRLGEGGAPTLGPWEEGGQLPLPEPRADAAAVGIGNFLYVLGGEGPNGPTNTVYRMTLDEHGDPAVGPDGASLGWGVPVEGGTGFLPAPRARGSTFGANGALYLIGGHDASGEPQSTVFWAVPDPTTGDIRAWSQLEQSQLPEGRARASVANVGAFAFLIGGEGPDGPSADAMRANLSPQLPFFRLGMFGATIPALSIKGEIGQQLGYLNAFGVGMTNFVILLAIGWAMSHREQTMRLLGRLSRGRIRSSREDEYTFASDRR